MVGRAGVIYDTCSYHSFSYAIPAEMAAYDWSLEVRAYDPRGVEVTAAWLWKDEGDPASGTASGADNGLQICSWEMPGTWRLEADLNFYGGPYSDRRLPDSTFTMRYANTHTTLAVNDTTAAYKQRLKFTIRSRAEYPEGFFPNAYATVRLQKKTASGWVTLKSATTGSAGGARIYVYWKPRSKVKVRAVTVGELPYSKSYSTPIVIR